MTRLWTALTRLFRRPPKAPTPARLMPAVATASGAPGRRTSDGEGSNGAGPPAGITKVRSYKKRPKNALRSTFNGHGPLGSVAPEPVRTLHNDPFAAGVHADSERDMLLSEIVIGIKEARQHVKTDADQAAIRKLSEAVSTHRLDLPRIPAVAQELMALNMDTNLSFEQLAEKVAQDQDLAARVLQVANSPIYTRSELSSLDRAVAQLGLSTFRDIVLGAVSDVAIYRVPGFDREVALERSTALKHARLASTYAHLIEGKSLAGTAWLGGLLHDAGRVLVYRNLSVARGADGKRVRLSPKLINALIIGLHAPLGLYYARERKLPRTVRVAMAHDEDYASVSAADRPLALSVAVAQEIHNSPLPAGSPIQARRVCEGLGLDGEDPQELERIQQTARACLLEGQAR